ncbi:MAG TPA: hypothetical protein VGN42_23970 [Pirellulales bacterium]|jgi:hypothetical protein|nr:hypothetical protein [Pirellulales bacterium]
MLPAIRSQLRYAFRRLQPEERSEALAEATASVAIVYSRLFQQGKIDVAYPSVLARFAAAQYGSGRRVGSRLNVNDLMSQYAQRRREIHVERLDRFDAEEGWKEVLVEDRTCTPAELAASRIDFEDWLHRLPAKRRRIAARLGAGEATLRVAQKFRLSPGRISQLRREFERDWRAFHGHPADEPI